MTVKVQAEPISISDLVSKIPEVHQSYVVVLDDDLDQSFLTSFTVAEWKKIALDVGYLTEDGLAVSLSTDLIETPDIKFPILKYVKIRPVVGYSFDRLFSGDNEDNDWGIASKERIFVGAQIVSIKF